ncbi:NADPH-dependent glutamate synthase beta subunit-like oxidoreductase [Clostridium saccharoperbutylacetonicum]|uniref:Sulfide dehydrogenase subunit alpha n=2 Tax=Clostridium TaxID=1485 RepID=M1MGL7_9CLOT|nr:NAD(P)-binding protein [Clostridium saccharoperbutylacetonicum]AGF57069.1 sulfide dehydrogenase subunit alpha [Clostridium saccharoperbutylacetonicum N1-4(HMT)]NRT62172.1 NADPH-dependent glutamate synthase beta subunit-like oxidoreductase [Clostridium saccharoperbutylacetonicum]NSB25503.1 NADPH-dependent glutamate synthase beta subunit-like oxidoreductase [Clostridium saccharoperbutylacetonicum]NSB44873.1 NADPH-dependent glutamate synthase beta subunit-like oxidoreductase [Clostridium saccha
MSRLEISTPNRAQTVVEGLYKDLERRIIASPPGLCPVDMAASFLKLCHAQTCGKCVPCRIGLGQLESLLNDVLNGNASLETIDLIEKTARVILNSADCAIGYEAADMVLKGVTGFRSDYLEHIINDRCICNLDQPVPCVALCPAGVDIPGYIALISEKRYADAVRLIRKDNPFPTTCALICEHPCEARCRRNMIDDSVNIRGLKRYAVDHAGKVPVPACSTATGKRVAIIGGGPGGLSAAYFLSLMGHKVTIFEKREKLGGMLRYGIPNYRLPRKRLEEDIEAIISTGVEIKTGITIGNDVSLADLKNEYDAIYIAIGAHTDKKIGIEGEESKGVISAVEMLRAIGDNILPDFTDKVVVVVGGGNVAMDVTRSSVRLGAKKVLNVYRRRKVDMTALPEEVEGAIAECCEILTLKAPIKIESDENGQVSALWVKPQMISKIDSYGRPTIVDSDEDEIRIPCDIVIVAIGQGIESRHFAEHGVPVKKGVIEALSSSGIENSKGIFAGGDCVTGPATVIRAIAAGKVAAANIDDYLGFNHIISVDVDIPTARLDDRPACGRVNMLERDAMERKNDFELIEYGMSCAEAHQESFRCLRCDHFGYGVFKGGRVDKW